MTETAEQEMPIPPILGRVPSKRIDVKPYIGTLAKLWSATVHHGLHGYYLRVQTTIVDKIEDVELRGSRVFGLVEREGGIGWVEGGALDLFLKEHGVTHFNELPGGEVILQRVVRGDKEFLTF